jgi:hypothetical protein
MSNQSVKVNWELLQEASDRQAKNQPQAAPAPSAPRASQPRVGNADESAARESDSE